MVHLTRLKTNPETKFQQHSLHTSDLVVLASSAWAIFRRKDPKKRLSAVPGIRLGLLVEFYGTIYSENNFKGGELGLWIAHPFDHMDLPQLEESWRPLNQVHSFLGLGVVLTVIILNKVFIKRQWNPEQEFFFPGVRKLSDERWHLSWVLQHEWELPT